VRKSNNESTFFKSPDERNRLSVEKVKKIMSNPRFSSIRKSADSEEERPFSTFEVKKTKSHTHEENMNLLHYNSLNNNPHINNNSNGINSNKNTTNNKNNESKNAIEQDLESINVILDRYGITPINRLSYSNGSNSYYVKVSKEENSNKSGKNDVFIDEFRPNFKKKSLINNNPQNTDKNSYLLSQDFELARPYELEPNYSKI